jgi:hypothetical protein
MPYNQALHCRAIVAALTVMVATSMERVRVTTVITNVITRLVEADLDV